MTGNDSGIESLFFVGFQMLQRVMVVAAESLKVLEHQLMDGSQTQDVRVGKKSFNTTCFISLMSCKF